MRNSLKTVYTDFAGLLTTRILENRYVLLVETSQWLGDPNTKQEKIWI